MVSHSVRILCVAADDDVRQLLLMVFRRESVEMQFVPTIEQALNLAMDDRFPDGDGIDLIRQLRAIDNVVPILIQSGNAYSADIRCGLEAGATIYYTKPVDYPEMVKRMKKPTGAGQVL